MENNDSRNESAEPKVGNGASSALQFSAREFLALAYCCELRPLRRVAVCLRARARACSGMPHPRSKSNWHTAFALCRRSMCRPFSSRTRVQSCLYLISAIGSRRLCLVCSARLVSRVLSTLFSRLRLLCFLGVCSLAQSEFQPTNPPLVFSACL